MEVSSPWAQLNHLQIGRYAEYLVKMNLTLLGFEVYTAEVDDRGIDFVTRCEGGPFLEVQAKSARDLNYVFIRKAVFPLSDTRYLALVLFPPSGDPDLFLIPARAWATPNALFVSRDYVGKRSDPEWGLNLSRKNLLLLEPFRLRTVAAALRGPH